MLRIPPTSTAKTQLKQVALSELDEFWADFLTTTPNSTYTIQHDEDGSWRMRRGDIHDWMVQWFEERHYKGPYPSVQALGTYLSRHFRKGGRVGFPKSAKMKGNLSNAWQFPPL